VPVFVGIKRMNEKRSTLSRDRQSKNRKYSNVYASDGLEPSDAYHAKENAQKPPMRANRSHLFRKCDFYFLKGFLLPMQP